MSEWAIAGITLCIFVAICVRVIWANRDDFK